MYKLTFWQKYLMFLRRSWIISRKRKSWGAVYFEHVIWSNNLPKIFDFLLRATKVALDVGRSQKAPSEVLLNRHLKRFLSFPMNLDTGLAYLMNGYLVVFLQEYSAANALWNEFARGLEDWENTSDIAEGIAFWVCVLSHKMIWAIWETLMFSLGQWFHSQNLRLVFRN